MKREVAGQTLYPFHPPKAVAGADENALSTQLFPTSVESAPTTVIEMFSGSYANYTNCRELNSC